MSNTDVIDRTTDTTKPASRYMRRRSDVGNAPRRANEPSTASFDLLAATPGTSSRHHKQRTTGDTAVAAAAIALEARAVSQAPSVAWKIPEIQPVAQLATPLSVEAEEDVQVRRVPLIVTILVVAGISMAMWGGIVALVFIL